MDTTIEILYLFLSKGENYIANDTEYLFSKNIISREEVTSGSSLFVCISRDYFDLPNLTPAVMIRDQLANVFCPPWRINSVKYESLLSIMNDDSGFIPEVRVITSDKEEYDNLDYFLHLSKFEKRYRMYLPNYKDGFFPIVSEISRPDIVTLGRLTLDVLDITGYRDDINGPVPGWIFQVANFWMTRLLDLYQIEPSLSIPWKTSLVLKDKMSRKDWITSLNNPIIVAEPKIGEDMRACLIDSFEVRKTLMEYTERLLDRIGEL